MSTAKRIHKISGMESAIQIPEDAPNIRVCYVTKRSNYLGYGFNLIANVSKPGQYIGGVERKSPAAAAGLKTGDRILAINDADISCNTHKEVVARLISVSDETKLKLVVLDQESGRYYRNKSIVMKKHCTNSNE